ncbi:MAG: lmo0937 family membrane protein [Candidatus Kapaibacterium sp.]
MLWAAAVLLLILWAVGFFSSFTMGGYIHVLLILVLVIVAFRLMSGEQVM